MKRDDFLGRFFEAAWAVLKIGSSLKPNYHWELSVPKSVKCSGTHLRVDLCFDPCWRCVFLIHILSIITFCPAHRGFVRPFDINWELHNISLFSRIKWRDLFSSCYVICFNSYTNISEMCWVFGPHWILSQQVDVYFFLARICFSVIFIPIIQLHLYWSWITYSLIGLNFFI